LKGFQNHDFGKLPFLLSALILLGACSFTQKQKALPYLAPSAQVSRIIEILDYQGRSSGEDVAEWVSLYINGGISALEGLDEFAPYFVFVAEQSSPDLDTLLQWGRNFSLERDIPQLVLLRAYRRLTGNLSINPDDMYGSFFETFIKRLAALRWPAARKHYEGWVLVRRVPLLPPMDASDSDISDSDVSDSDTPDAGPSEQSLPQEAGEASFDSRLYMYLILNLIERTGFERSLKLIMNDITLDKSLSRDQVQAINSIKSNLFNGF
jgi:hypothetical protein